MSDNMKAWVLHDINDIRMEEVKKPVPGKGEALVRVMAAGICGSDIPRIFKTGAHNMPLIPGHEFSGVVEAVGESYDFDLEKNEAVSTGRADGNKKTGGNYADAWVGKRVGIFPLIPCRKCDPCQHELYEMCKNYNYLGSRCDGAFAEYVTVPVANLIELPDNVSFQAAAMLEPMAVAVHAMRAMEKELIKYKKINSTDQLIYSENTPVDNNDCNRVIGSEENLSQEMISPSSGRNASQEIISPDNERNLLSKEINTDNKNSIQIAVCGVGTIGLLLCMVLKASGYENIIAIGNKEAQRQTAMDAGAKVFAKFDGKTTDIFCEEQAGSLVRESVNGKPDPLSEGASASFVEGMDFDVFFECVGKNETLSLGVEKLNFHGVLITVGNPYSDMTLDRNIYWKILRNQLTIRGVWNSSFTGHDNDDWHYVLKFLSGHDLLSVHDGSASCDDITDSEQDISGTGKESTGNKDHDCKKGMDPSVLITHEFAIDDLMRGLTIMRDKTEYYCKVMLSMK